MKKMKKPCIPTYFLAKSLIESLETDLGFALADPYNKGYENMDKRGIGTFVFSTAMRWL